MRASTYGREGACGRVGNAQLGQHVHPVGDLCLCDPLKEIFCVRRRISRLPGVYWCKLFLGRRERPEKEGMKLKWLKERAFRVRIPTQTVKRTTMIIKVFFLQLLHVSCTIFYLHSLYHHVIV